MSQTISVYGPMYEFNYVEVSEKDVKRLLEAKGSGDNFWESLDELHDLIMGNSIINGFSRVPEVFVDGDEVKVESSFVEGDYSNESIEPTPLKKHYLIVEKWSKNGQLSLEIEDDFELSELSFDVEEESLPNGKTRKVLEVSYDFDLLEFQSSDSVRQDLYVLKSDGTRIDL